MQNLMVEQIITLHKAIIQTDGGDNRLLSEASLHQVVFRANLIHDVIPRAAFVFYSLVAYPAFREGNRRLAREMATNILGSGGYCISPADETKLDQLEEGILSFTSELQESEAWFTSHARKQ
jgi:prophage maintenance system killer protein